MLTSKTQPKPLLDSAQKGTQEHWKSSIKTIFSVVKADQLG